MHRHLLYNALLLVLLGSPTVSSAQTDQEPKEEYHASQALDGFGAFFVGIGEPVLLPIDQFKKCQAESDNSLRSTGCGLLGFLASPILMLRDGFVGLGDIFSGGYFTISRKSGVFDYFKDEEKKKTSSILTPAPSFDAAAAPSLSTGGNSAQPQNYSHVRVSQPGTPDSSKVKKDRACLAGPRASSFFTLVCIGQFFYETHDKTKADDVSRDVDQFRPLLECSDETVSRIVALAKSRGIQVAGSGMREGPEVEKGCKSTSLTSLQTIEAELN